MSSRTGAKAAPLYGKENETRVVLSQDNNLSENARAHSQANWETMLNALKEFVEK
jgi:hypothetical protein